MPKPAPKEVAPGDLLQLARAVLAADRFPHLATIDGTTPRVRPVSPVRTDGFTVYVANLRSYHKTELMKRIPEPELMDSDEQARAYAAADFSEAHQSYVTLFHETFPVRPPRATVLDLGCGAADVVIRFAKANPRYTFDAVDGSAAMLKYARKALRGSPNLARRIKLTRAFIPDARLPRKTYHVILSSNFLHHLHEPEALWQTIRRYAKHGTLVFVTDLFRPPNRAAAKRLVERYAAAEPAILQRDFMNSLLASFTVEEVREQLLEAHLGHLRIEVISDRHVMIFGRM